MTLLLDTHAFLWFVLNDPNLSPAAQRLISDPDTTILISPASYWEIAIKIRTGKYQLPEPFAEFMIGEIARNNLVILPITVDHAAVVTTLPRHHRDPFDRLLIAQAMSEGIGIISADIMYDSYPVTRLW